MSDYQEFVPLLKMVMDRLPNERKVVYEIGSLHAKDAIFLQKSLGATRVVSFECNPPSIEECKRNLSNEGKDLPITLVEKAVSDQVGTCTFMPFDPERYNNPGASSLFEIDFSGRPDYDPDHVLAGKSVQNEIKVETTTLDFFVIEQGNPFPSIICMDVQEAELLVLKGAERVLQVPWGVLAIVLEASFRPTYKGGCSYDEIVAFLESRGFAQVQKQQIDYCHFSNFIFVRRELLQQA